MMRSSSSAANFDGIISNNNNKFQVDDDEVLLPGFRFHPTDEELVGFYLRRKVEKKAFSIELIKQIDIYKYDPWDLPKVSTVGDKELYFFCIRERKYRNSVRPNRVTGSGFWKATGIDKPIYSVGGRDHNINNKDHCIIGLKKSLVYYRGSAGKGTKTDWMMHEFRLPPPLIGTAVKSTTNNHQQHHQNSSAKIINSTTHDHQEAAEIWTLCRIFKRNVVSYKNKYPQAAAADCKEELMTSSSSIIQNSSPSTYSSSSSPPPRHHQQSFSLESENRDHQKYNNNKYYCSGLLASNMVHHHQQIIKGKTRQLPVVANHIINERNNINSTLSPAGQLMSCITHHHEPSTTSTSLLQPNHNFQNLNANSDFFSGRDGNWDELGSVVEFMSDQSLLYGYR